MNILNLLAQNNSGGEEALAVGIMLMVVVVAIAISIAIAIVVILLLQGPLKAIPAEHRKIEPGQVWLLLIPFFNLYWNFRVFIDIPDSFKSYFDSIGRTDVGDCARGVGKWYAICVVCGLVPCVNYIAGPASLVLLIIFLVKTHGLKDQVRASAQPGV